MKNRIRFDCKDCEDSGCVACCEGIWAGAAARDTIPCPPPGIEPEHRFEVAALGYQFDVKLRLEAYDAAEQREDGAFPFAVWIDIDDYELDAPGTSGDEDIAGAGFTPEEAIADTLLQLRRWADGEGWPGDATGDGIWRDVLYGRTPVATFRNPHGFDLAN